MRGMNKLPLDKRVQILTMLVEGSSMRSVSRVCGVSINTVTKLLVDAGTACAAFHDERVRNVTAKAIQCDEIWSFSYAKNKNVRFAKAVPEAAGDVWTWTAIDADSKLIVSWHVGDRSQHTGISFMGDLKARLANRVQLTTDGHKAYLRAVEVVDFDADYAMLNKIRMAMRRFTRLTNAFSKKFENHCHALALYFFWYNWVRNHKTLGVTPAMAAGLVQTPMKFTDLLTAMDTEEQSRLAEKRQAIIDASEQSSPPQSN